jgi:hypothetical protein
MSFPFGFERVKDRSGVGETNVEEASSVIEQSECRVVVKFEVSGLGCGVSGVSRSLDIRLGSQLSGGTWQI